MSALTFDHYKHVASATSITSNSFTPSSGDLIIAAVSALNSTTPTMSDSQSLGWTSLGTATFATGADKLCLFAANATAAASAMTVTATLGGATEWYLALWRISSASHTGSAIKKQISTVSDRDGANAPNAAFSVSAGAADACLSVMAVNSRIADTAGPTVGTWTRDFSDVFSGTNENMWADHAAVGGFTGTDPTYTDHPGNGTSFAQILIEFDFSSAAASLVYADRRVARNSLLRF